MKIKLVFQKTYFKSNEWKEVVSFFKTFNLDLNILLLSKNIFINPLKKIKGNLLGECFLVEINILTLSTYEILTCCFDLISKITSKYINRIFCIGFLIEIKNQLFFFSMSVIKNYLAYLTFRRKNNSSMYSINSFFLYELFKFNRILNIKSNISLFFVKNYNLTFFFNYYY